MADLDSPWKELLEQDAPQVLAFFFPDVHADLDWPRGVEALEQEMRKAVPQSAEGKRVVDKLLKAYQRQTGDERYLHLEVQAWREAGFERRVYVYNSRAEDRFGQPVVSLLLLIDDDPGWRPTRYVAELYGTRRELTFRPAKVLDWAGREAELEADANPVGLFVLAHLEGRRTRGDEAERAAVKKRLILRLHQRGLRGEEVRHWYAYFDWLLPLSREYDRQVWLEVRRFEKEEEMPYVTFAERYGREQGLEEGMEKGLEKGLEKGQRIGLCKAIALGVRLKFGPDAAAALMPEVEKQQKLDVLEAVYNAIETAGSVDDLRKLLPGDGDDRPA